MLILPSAKDRFTDFEVGLNENVIGEGDDGSLSFGGSLRNGGDGLGDPVGEDCDDSRHGL